MVWDDRKEGMGYRKGGRKKKINLAWEGNKNGKTLLCLLLIGKVNRGVFQVSLFVFTVKHLFIFFNGQKRRIMCHKVRRSPLAPHLEGQRVYVRNAGLLWRQIK